MKRILNVVCVYFSLPFFFGDQLSYFSQKGYDIHLVCSPSDRIAAFSAKHKCRYKEVSILRKFSVGDDLAALFRLYKYIRRNKFDIVCGHTPKGGLLSMIAAYLAGVPNRVFFRHGLVYETSSGLKRLILMNAERITSFFATRVVCVSPYLIERSRADHLTSEAKMTLLHIGSCNGVDAHHKYNPELLDEKKKQALSARLSIAEGVFVIGYTGRLVGDKGVAELVNAFVELQKGEKNICLLLVGPFEERDCLSAVVIDTIKSNEQIIYTGLVEEDMEYYYSLMDVLVLPTHREGFGTSILEASAMEIPVLTTSHTGSRDAIANNVTGMYIGMDTLSIRSKIEIYMQDESLRRKHGRNGREFICKNFEEELIWREIETKLYQ